MRIRFVIAIVLSFFVSLPAMAFEIEDMTDAERQAFRAEIRAYLLENPEVLMEAIAVLEERRQSETQAAEVALLEQNRDAIYDDGFSYVGGNPEGDVVLVEFLDYQCGFCKRAFPAVQELLTGDGNIKFIVKEFPILGEASVLASRYALATKRVEGDQAYIQVHDELMVLRGHLNEEALERLSQKLNLNHRAIARAMDDREITDIIHANRALGQRLQIQGTPTFIMGDTIVRGFLELDQMLLLVESIRREQS